MSDHYDIPMDELFVKDQQEHWVTLRQGGVDDCYQFSVDRSGRCFRIGQVDADTDDTTYDMHICNPELLHTLLGKAIAWCGKEWGYE